MTGYKVSPWSEDLYGIGLGFHCCSEIIAAFTLGFQLLWLWVCSASRQTKLNGHPSQGKKALPNSFISVLLWSVKHTTQAVPLPSFLRILQGHSKFYRQDLTLHIHSPFCSQHCHVPRSLPWRNTKEGFPSCVSASQSPASPNTFF